MNALLFSSGARLQPATLAISKERDKDDLEESSEKSIAPFLLKSAAVGIVVFWMVGVWLLPEKAIVLHNYRLYMSICVVLMSLGA